VAGTTTSNPMSTRENAAAMLAFLTFDSKYRWTGLKTKANAPAQTNDGMQG